MTLLKFATLLAVVSLAALIFAFAVRSHDLNRIKTLSYTNCTQVETLKAIQYRALARQINGSTQFLRAHPNGIPGISPKLISQGIADNEKTLHELAPRPC